MQKEIDAGMKKGPWWFELYIEDKNWPSFGFITIHGMGILFLPNQDFRGWDKDFLLLLWWADTPEALIRSHDYLADV